MSINDFETSEIRVFITVILFEILKGDIILDTTLRTLNISV
ncbi:hypothetical protein LEP1GSC050_1921 [Leptospira broomii serovar Hurstbridge str. 5399]|uniref:Uncharacterized protein n=1 Tax=Leptospira broomii serovar Hurstbridge str. 5399 TaxID=1049789 RepID=T0F090_9LEPT|nr:hypothetical protein LEP1GSC050_1921 [Leptospira broomii serovar Hurstbridge str. 5399]